MTLCACGCGQPTNIATDTRHRKGHVKGTAYRYLGGHNRKNTPTKEYRYALIRGAREAVHRTRATKALGKPLPLHAVVHHVDGTKDENSGLVICENQAYHLLLHHRTRIVQAGGNPNTEQVCGRCKQVKPRAAFSIDRTGSQGYATRCRECMSACRTRSKQEKARRASDVQ